MIRKPNAVVAAIIERDEWFRPAAMDVNADGTRVLTVARTDDVEPPPGAVQVPAMNPP